MEFGALMFFTDYAISAIGLMSVEIPFHHDF